MCVASESIMSCVETTQALVVIAFLEHPHLLALQCWSMMASFAVPQSTALFEIAQVSQDLVLIGVQGFNTLVGVQGFNTLGFWNVCCCD